MLYHPVSAPTLPSDWLASLVHQVLLQNVPTSVYGQGTKEEYIDREASELVPTTVVSG